MIWSLITPEPLCDMIFTYSQACKIVASQANLIFDKLLSWGVPTYFKHGLLSPICQMHISFPLEQLKIELRQTVLLRIKDGIAAKLTKGIKGETEATAMCKGVLPSLVCALIFDPKFKSWSQMRSSFCKSLKFRINTWRGVCPCMSLELTFAVYLSSVISCVSRPYIAHKWSAVIPVASRSFMSSPIIIARLN